MTTAQVVETSVTVNNSPIQDYVHPDDQTQPTFEMTPGFKPFTKKPMIPGHCSPIQYLPEIIALITCAQAPFSFWSGESPFTILR